jgi:DNA-directed RNA polymerase specialized sigma subunit
MESIFETITKNLPKATEEQKQQLAALEPQPAPAPTDNYEKLSLKDLVPIWTKDPNEEITSIVLKKLKPTISSAMTSYAPGHQKDLVVKAAKLSLDALRSFDPSRGVDPATHVFNQLKRLNRYATKRQNIIPISERRAMMYKLVQQASDQFQDDYGREPSELELADLTGLSLRKVRQILDGDSIVSETSQVNPESHNSTFFSSDLTDDDYYEYVYRSVGPIDQKIMEWSSGKRGKKPLQVKEIAEKLHISPSAVSARRQKILDMLSEVRGLV